MVDLTEYYEILDEHIKTTGMPEEYADKQVDILCNECLTTSNVPLHFYGLKCPNCGSYNTKQVLSKN
jgi:RING finger/CHY zinc finger protein 1